MANCLMTTSLQYGILCQRSMVAVEPCNEQGLLAARPGNGVPMSFDCGDWVAAKTNSKKRPQQIRKMTLSSYCKLRGSGARDDA